jgi:hypothetical protein
VFGEVRDQFERTVSVKERKMMNERERELTSSQKAIEILRSLSRDYILQIGRDIVVDCGMCLRNLRCKWFSMMITEREEIRLL